MELPDPAHQPLADHFRHRVPFATDEEVATFVAAFRPRHVRRRQFIVQPDFVARHRSYVLKGALRAYLICKLGTDQTIQFAIEDWWISDYNSYIFQQPATCFVMALEDSLLLQIDHQREQELKRSAHVFETFFRITAERSTAAMQRRLITNLTMTAGQRYAHFLKHYGEVANRAPQYAVASYLGMTTEFLSRLRNGRAS